MLAGLMLAMVLLVASACGLPRFSGLLATVLFGCFAITLCPDANKCVVDDLCVDGNCNLGYLPIPISSPHTFADFFPLG